MIGSSIVNMMVDGVLTIIQTIRYSNGETTNRILDPKTMLPIGTLEK
jgi:hypothetical protein